MNPKEFLDAVERHLGSETKPREQRFLAREYDAEFDDGIAGIYAKLIKRSRSESC